MKYVTVTPTIDLSHSHAIYNISNNVFFSHGVWLKALGSLNNKLPVAPNTGRSYFIELPWKFENFEKKKQQQMLNIFKI